MQEGKLATFFLIRFRRNDLLKNLPLLLQVVLSVWFLCLLFYKLEWTITCEWMTEIKPTMLFPKLYPKTGRES